MIAPLVSSSDDSEYITGQNIASTEDGHVYKS